MFINRTFASTFGPILSAPPPPVLIPRERGACLDLAASIDRRASDAFDQGHFEAADRLAHLAHEARRRAGAAR